MLRCLMLDHADLRGFGLIIQIYKNDHCEYLCLKGKEGVGNERGSMMEPIEATVAVLADGIEVNRQTKVCCRYYYPTLVR
jgi:hypothetical protein